MLFLALSACGKSSLTSSSDIPTAILTPSGALALYGHTYGRVLPWHVETAEASWQHVAPCVGVELDAARAFPVLLLSGPTVPGEYGHDLAGFLALTPEPHIEIIGASWDFDPARPEASPGPTAEIARVWKHELIHLGLHLRDGDADAKHARAEWGCER